MKDKQTVTSDLWVILNNTFSNNDFFLHLVHKIFIVCKINLAKYKLVNQKYII
jgi:hypothetical protein